MPKNLNALQQALEAKQPPKPVRVPAKKDEDTSRNDTAPSRRGKKLLGAWLAPDFKANLRLIQARHPSKDIQSLLAEALNDLFQKYGVPTIHQD